MKRILAFLALTIVYTTVFSQENQGRAEELFDQIIDKTDQNYNWNNLNFNIKNEHYQVEKMYDDAFAEITRFKSKSDAELKKINQEVDNYLAEYKNGENKKHLKLVYNGQGTGNEIFGEKKNRKVIDESELEPDCMVCLLENFLKPKMDTQNTYRVKNGIIRIDKDRKLEKDGFYKCPTNPLKMELSNIFKSMGFNGKYDSFDFMVYTNRYEYGFKRKSANVILINFVPDKDDADFNGYAIINTQDKAILELHIGSVKNANLPTVHLGILGFKKNINNYNLNLEFKKVNNVYVPIRVQEDKTVDFTKNKRKIKFIENADKNPEKLVFKYNDARIKTTEKTFEFEIVD
jgi:hypothetical protein